MALTSENQAARILTAKESQALNPDFAIPTQFEENSFSLSGILHNNAEGNLTVTGLS